MIHKPDIGLEHMINLYVFYKAMLRHDVAGQYLSGKNNAPAKMLLSDSWRRSLPENTRASPATRHGMHFFCAYGDKLPSALVQMELVATCIDSPWHDG